MVRFPEYLPHPKVEKKNVWQNLGKEEFGSNSDQKLEPG